MRVLIAPDKFAGTLTAPQACAAIAEGWARTAPGDVLDLAPMADGGPGFLDVLRAAGGGELFAITVAGPSGVPAPAAILVQGSVAYLETAQACGRALTDGQDAEHATTYGVGELVVAAVESGVRTVVLGLGGSGTSDGGAGMLAALGATADVPLDRGAAGLAGIGNLDLAGPRRRLARVELVAARDVDNPLTGLFGAVRQYGAQKGIAEDRMPAVDGWLEAFAGVADRRLALLPGAGAAGGLGFTLALLGAGSEPGVDLVADRIGLAERAAKADIVITGEGSFDYSSRAGKVPYGVARVALGVARPCLVLAGQVSVGVREARALGVESAYSVSELVGDQRALSEPAVALAELAERVARTWSAGH